MISLRTCSIATIAALFVLAAGAADQPAKADSTKAVKPAAKTAPAAKAEPAKPAAETSGVGIPGEVLFTMPSLEATWQTYGGRLAMYSLVDKRTGEPQLISQEAFVISFEQGPPLRSSHLEASSATIEKLKPQAHGANLGQQAGGKRARVSLVDSNGRIRATWTALHHAGSDYVRQLIRIEALKEMKIADIRLVSIQIPNVRVVGKVDGCPVITDSLFMGVEHPMAKNEITPSGVYSGLSGPIVLKPGQVLEVSSVIGAYEKGQLRRAFNTYLERERAHSYRTFLHYNSWYDIGYFSKYDEAAALGVVGKFGEELAEKRGVKINSFLFDDGWDDTKTLWGFHGGFLKGFANVRKAAAEFDAAPGVWMSPFGGYGKPRDERIKAGVAQGFETNASGFALSGPKYFERFRATTLDFANKYGVNQFKFDGIGDAATAMYPGSAFRSDFDAAIALIRDIRAVKPDMYINLTTGTWPSPFWTLIADSIWRGGEDHQFAGVGSDRQKWITYRDADTYSNVVQSCSLYPLTSLMLHGIIYAKHASKLANDPSGALTGEIRSYFGSGTQLQEMYVTPSLLTAENWDVLAEAARWSRANADVLVDTHWIGGNPAALEVYGWAAWTAKKAVVTLRNPSDKPQDYELDVGAAFELPAGAPTQFTLVSPWACDAAKPQLSATAGTPLKITLQPFEVVNLEAWPPNAKIAPAGSYSPVRSAVKKETKKEVKKTEPKKEEPKAVAKKEEPKKAEKKPEPKKEEPKKVEAKPAAQPAAKPAAPVGNINPNAPVPLN